MSSVSLQSKDGFPIPEQAYIRILGGLKKLGRGALYDLFQKCTVEGYNFPRFPNTHHQLKDQGFIQEDGKIVELVKEIVLISVVRNKDMIHYTIVDQLEVNKLVNPRIL